jgi:hypothetical protein
MSHRTLLEDLENTKPRHRGFEADRLEVCR